MSDKGKLVLTGSDDVQSIARMVKRAREQEKVIKFKIGRQTVHVEFVDDPEQGMERKFLLQETGLLSCSPDVIAQSIFDDYLKPANLAPVPPKHRKLCTFRALWAKTFAAANED